MYWGLISALWSVFLPRLTEFFAKEKHFEHKIWIVLGMSALSTLVVSGVSGIFGAFSWMQLGVDFLIVLTGSVTSYKAMWSNMYPKDPCPIPDVK